MSLNVLIAALFLTITEGGTRYTFLRWFVYEFEFEFYRYGQKGPGRQDPRGLHPEFIIPACCAAVRAGTAAQE